MATARSNQKTFPSRQPNKERQADQALDRTKAETKASATRFMEGKSQGARRHYRRVLAAWNTKCTGENQTWCIDIHNEVVCERKARWEVIVIDLFEKQIKLNVSVANSPSPQDIVSYLNSAIRRNGRPGSLSVEHASTFFSKTFTRWAYSNQITLRFRMPSDYLFRESP